MPKAAKTRGLRIGLPAQVSGPRRWLNAVMVVATTCLVTHAVMTTSMATRGGAEVIGMVAAAAATTLVAAWHLRAARRDERYAYTLGILHVVTLTSLFGYSMSFGKVPFEIIRGIAYLTIASVASAFAMSIAIAVMGLRPTPLK